MQRPDEWRDARVIGQHDLGGQPDVSGGCSHLDTELPALTAPESRLSVAAFGRRIPVGEVAVREREGDALFVTRVERDLFEARKLAHGPVHLGIGSPT